MSMFRGHRRELEPYPPLTDMRGGLEYLPRPPRWVWISWRLGRRRRLGGVGARGRAGPGGSNTLRVLAIKDAGWFDLILMTWSIAFSMTSLALSLIGDKDESEGVLDQGQACSQVLRLLQPRGESPGGGAEGKPGSTCPKYWQCDMWGDTVSPCR